MNVYTGGTFDLFHHGHVRFLSRCAEFGNVTVGVNSDEFIAQFKKKAPVIPMAERIIVLESCRWVHRVIVNIGNEDSKPAIIQAEPDIIIVGSDWARRDYHAQIGVTQDWLDQLGIGLLFLPYTSGVSSTLIRERLT